MPIIRCTLAKDGKLVPTAVEFEPGDVIQFKSDQPVYLPGLKSEEIRVEHPMNLSALSVQVGNTTGIQFDPDRAATGPRTPPPGPPHYPVTISIVTELAGVAAV